MRTLSPALPALLRTAALTLLLASTLPAIGATDASRRAAARLLGPTATAVEWGGRGLTGYNRAGGGFAIVGDGGRVYATAAEGTLSADLTAAPPAFVSWLACARAKAAAGDGGAPEPIEGPGVDLPTAHYSQQLPYNLMCPTYAADGLQCVTGCCATALVEVMRFHQWPPHGIGVADYDAGENVGPLYRDLSLDTYDWSLLKGRYSADDTSESAWEVAKIMLDAGMAMESEYGSTNVGGTSAYDCNIGRAALRSFGYDRALRAPYADYMPRSLWRSLVIENLRQGMPMVYCGADVDEEGEVKTGHAFVCEGFNTDGYFHINWGASGGWDGWFDLDVLQMKPATEECEGGDCYWFGQYAVLGMRPPVEGSVNSVALGADGLTLTADGDRACLAVAFESIFNGNASPFSGTLSLEVVRLADDAAVYRADFLAVDASEPLDTGEALEDLEPVLIPAAALGGVAGDYRLDLYATDGEGTREQFWGFRPDLHPATFAVADDGLFVKTTSLTPTATLATGAGAVCRYTLGGVALRGVREGRGVVVGSDGSKRLMR